MTVIQAGTTIAYTGTSRKIKKKSNNGFIMLTAHGRKRSFRAKAVANLRGLTIDTKIAQDVFRAKNTTIAVKGPFNGIPTMLGGRENMKDPRDKRELKGLTVDTKMGQDMHNSENAGAAVDTRMARKASNTGSPRLSEAMMNKNWRNNRRTLEDDSLDMMQSPWSAPPEKLKFPNEVKAKPRRDDEYEMIDYDRGLERAAYRCRRPDDVKPELIPYTTAESVSADLCLSAPATKTEFSEAEMGTEERSEKYNPSVFQPSVKSVVRLNQMAPIKRAGYEKIINWDERHANTKADRRSCLRNSSSITAVSLAGPSQSWEHVDFPYAEIRAVNYSKRFETGLSGVEETIRKQLAALVEPQSAGIPPEYLRKEYEEIREERRKAMALAESTIGTRVCWGGISSKQEAVNLDGAKDTGFNDLLGKLNKLCAPRIRAFTINDKDSAHGLKNTPRGEDIVKYDTQHSPSGDSGISGLSAGGRKRSSTLNPEAVEFQCTLPEKELSVTKGCDSDQDKTLKRTPEAVDPIRLLETRVAELEAQIARQESKQGQFSRQKWPKGYKTGQPSYGSGGYSPIVASGGACHSAMNGAVQSPTGYQPACTIPTYRPQPGLTIGVGGMHPNMPIATHCGLPQNGPIFLPDGIPTGRISQYNTTQPVVPLQDTGALVATKPALGSPLWVKSVFGPKPVSKPDRPFRPGDGMQATRQQEYEEYLEHLRATDPNYALSCKQRQARRADRQRLGPPSSSGGSGQRLIY